jgi:DNA-binding Lrp family transcriptional regulator
VIAKSQDVLVGLKLVVSSSRQSYAELAAALGMSASEVHASVRRLTEARLVDPDTRQVRREALRSFLVHGVPYAFPAQLREITRGMQTAWAAPVLAKMIQAPEQAPPVWPDSQGTVQGAAVEPLYPSVPNAARRDPELYDLLALVDALRIGRARERSLAEAELTRRLKRDVAA